MAEEHVVRLLDTNTANQIAAGEVVEKPASVVKELVENSLDAGADNIDVMVFAGGIEYIRVMDNGCGMNKEDAKLAVQRHATSKLRNADDLLRLHTLGFRGEALPSIASVSHFTLLTRPQDDEFATVVHINGGAMSEVSSTGAAAGTTIIVEDLFYNMPARRKFLKTEMTEGRHISEALTRLALSRPDVRFHLENNDKEVLSTPGDGDLAKTIRALYGKKVAENLLAVELHDPAVEITGFIGRPTLLKGTRGWQTFFVNGRSINSKMLAKAIDHAYQSQIPKSGFPFAVLNIKVDTATVDVNVHPQKSEVKFSDEGLIYRALFKALTMALTRPMSAEKTQVQLLPDSELNVFMPASPKTTLAVHREPPVMQTSAAKTPASGGAAQPLPSERLQRDASALFCHNDGVLKESAGGETSVEERLQAALASVGKPKEEQQPEQETLTTSYSNGYQEPMLAVHEARAEFGAKPQQAAKSVSANEQAVSTATAAQEQSSKPQAVPRETIAFTDTDSGLATIWPIGQVDKTFIIAQSETALYLIDQHAAHERILYDKLVASHEHVPSQQLLMPLYVDMDDDDIALIEAHAAEFADLGVEAGSAGEGLLRVSSLPADIKADDAEAFIKEISKMLRELRTVNGSDLRQEVLHMTACKAAIKAGQLLTMQQMRQLIIDLCNTTHPFTCPHGRPCMIEINSTRLYTMFKRNGF